MKKRLKRNKGKDNSLPNTKHYVQFYYFFELYDIVCKKFRYCLTYKKCIGYIFDNLAVSFLNLNVVNVQWISNY